jgi:hypothetical protein
VPVLSQSAATEISQKRLPSAQAKSTPATVPLLSKSRKQITLSSGYNAEHGATARRLSAHETTGTRGSHFATEEQLHNSHL